MSVIAVEESRKKQQTVQSQKKGEKERKRKEERKGKNFTGFVQFCALRRPSSEHSYLLFSSLHPIVIVIK